MTGYSAEVIRSVAKAIGNEAAGNGRATITELNLAYAILINLAVCKEVLNQKKVARRDARRTKKA